MLENKGDSTGGGATDQPSGVDKTEPVGSSQKKKDNALAMMGLDDEDQEDDEA